MTELTVTSEHTYQVIGRILCGPIEREAWADYVEHMRAEIAAQAAEIERLREAANALQLAEAAYRLAHDTKGAQSRESGYFWDKMRKRGDDVRALLAPAPDPAPAATSIPALSEYAAEQVAKVTAQKMDERNGKR